MDEEEPELELDGPWKEVVGEFFEDFLRFFFASVHAAVDWSRGHEFLDKELEKLARDSEAGRGTVDKLARVWLPDGSERWLLVHVEVQNQSQTTFAERMYKYNHRLRDYYGRMPVSVAVLGDDRVGWRPTEFLDGQLGCEVRFRFLTAKLLEWVGLEDELTADTNPFAAVVLAHLKAMETRGCPDVRFEWKRTVTRGLYDRGFDRERVRRLFRVIDWIMALSPARERAFEIDHYRFEEDRKMPFVSPMEQLWLDRGIEKGRIATLHSGIEAILERRFRSPGGELLGRIRSVRDVAMLSDIQLLAATADDLVSFMDHLNSALERADATP